jgi:hypothetical protein
MVWTDVAFKALTGFAVGSDENALNNPLLIEKLLNGHVAIQVLAIRRLMDKRSGGIISLPRLVKDLGRHFDLFTRENYVCFDGLPYDYVSVREAQFMELAQQRTPGISWGPTSGPHADFISEITHRQFDKLAGIDHAKRNREDRVPNRLLKTIEGWLDGSGADDLAKWSHAYLAHAGDPRSREAIADLQVTANKIIQAIRMLARTTEAISARLLNAGGRSSNLMPFAQFNQFEKLDRPIMVRGGEAAAYSRWRQLSDEWNDCLNGVEDELLGGAALASKPTPDPKAPPAAKADKRARR